LPHHVLCWSHIHRADNDCKDDEEESDAVAAARGDGDSTIDTGDDDKDNSPVCVLSLKDILTSAMEIMEETSLQHSPCPQYPGKKARYNNHSYICQPL
jgi:hypothetical protein